MTYHSCVWIDHREARILHLTAHSVETAHVRDHGTEHHGHRHVDHGGSAEIGESFMADVAKAIAGARAILIVGPGQARTAFKSYLDTHQPALAKNVWDVKAADHPTDGELTAMARAYFHAEDRMR